MSWQKNINLKFPDFEGPIFPPQLEQLRAAVEVFSSGYLETVLYVLMQDTSDSGEAEAMGLHFTIIYLSAEILMVWPMGHDSSLRDGVVTSCSPAFYYRGVSRQQALRFIAKYLESKIVKLQELG